MFGMVGSAGAWRHRWGSRATLRAVTPESWHLRAVLLPEGADPVDLWVADGRLTTEPQARAEPLPGRGAGRRPTPRAPGSPRAAPRRVGAARTGRRPRPPQHRHRWHRAWSRLAGA